LFRPETYAAVRRPLLEASTLPPACYTSPAFYRREVQTIFMKVWNFIGRADRIPDAGDYFTIEFADVPVIVMRGAMARCGLSPIAAGTAARCCWMARATAAPSAAPIIHGPTTPTAR